MTDVELRTLTRDPCTCDPSDHLCASCEAWERNRVLVGGVVVATALEWRQAYHCVELGRELEALLEEPDVTGRKQGGRAGKGRFPRFTSADTFGGLFV